MLENDNIDERWKISAERKRKALERQLAIACGEDDDATPKDQTAAFKAILAAEGQNIADEHKQLDRMDAGRNRILALLGGSGAGSGLITIEPGGKRIADGGDKQPSQSGSDGADKGRGARKDTGTKQGVAKKDSGVRVNSRDPVAKRGGKKKKD